MFTLAKNEIILQGHGLHTLHKAYNGPCNDLRRLLEPEGRVFSSNGVFPMYYMGDSLFTSDPKEMLWKGNRVQAMEKLIAQFSNKEEGHTHVDQIKLFYFEPVSTYIRFKYHEEERFKGFKIWDDFNQMWRKFELAMGGSGVEIITETPVTINVHDSRTSIRIHMEVCKKTLTKAWVEKEGNLGVVEEFELYTTNGIFEYLVLEKLPEDHPGFEVVPPTTTYSNNNSFNGGLNNHHMHLLGGGAAMPTGGPY